MRTEIQTPNLELEKLPLNFKQFNEIGTGIESENSNPIDNQLFNLPFRQKGCVLESLFGAQQ